MYFWHFSRFHVFGIRRPLWPAGVFEPPPFFLYRIRDKQIDYLIKSMKLINSSQRLSRVGLPLGRQCLRGNLPGGPWGAGGEPGGALGGTCGGPVDQEDTGFQKKLSILFIFGQLAHLFLHRFVDRFRCTFWGPWFDSFLQTCLQCTTCFRSSIRHLFLMICCSIFEPSILKKY